MKPPQSITIGLLTRGYRIHGCASAFQTRSPCFLASPIRNRDATIRPANQMLGAIASYWYARRIQMCLEAAYVVVQADRVMRYFCSRDLFQSRGEDVSDFCLYPFAERV